MSNIHKKNAPPVDDDIAVSLRLFAAVSIFRAESDIRWYLMGVHVLPNPAGEGVFLVATDGHQLAIAHDPTGRAPGPVTLACSKAFAKAVRACRDNLRAHVVVRGDRVTALDSERREIFVQPDPALLEGKYPAALAVLKPILDPSLEPGMLGCFNPVYVRRLGRAASLLPTAGQPLGHWTHPNGTLYTRFAAEVSMVAVTMNMRGDEPYRDAVPDTLKAAIEKHRCNSNAAAAAEAEFKAREVRANSVVNSDAEPQECPT